jgi:8-amino-7-oxononanoate synthase
MRHMLNILNRVGAALDAELAEELEQLEQSGLHRKLRRVGGRQGPRMSVDGHDIVMLAGANYLDLAADPRVLKASAQAVEAFGCAAGGARLISGNLELHEDLESELARFVGSEACLLFSTGYMANLGVITTLAGPNDVLVSDKLNHASIIDACRLSRAETRTFRHNDVQDFHDVVKGLDGFRRRILIVDGVFSMEGDVAPLDQIVPIARQYDMLVVVDDAHGIGVLGEHGGGTAQQFGVECDLVIGNLGKAFGSFGAFVACSETMREYLVNRCRTFIFTCSLPAGPIAAARAALAVCQGEPERKLALLARAKQLRAGLRQSGYDTGHSSSHIVPAIVGDSRVATELCERALDRGVFVQAIRYPSVPRATARLRFAPMATHSTATIQSAIDLFGELKPSLCLASKPIHPIP